MCDAIEYIYNKTTAQISTQKGAVLMVIIIIKR